MKDMNIVTERHIPERDDDFFCKDLVLKCETGKIYYYFSGRNAWHSTWIQRYPNESAFELTWDDIVMQIEKRRTNGSTWTLKELPALIFHAADEMLIVTEINTSTILWDCKDLLPLRPTLYSIANMFLSQNSIRKVIFRGDIKPTMNMAEALKTRKSLSYGKSYRLGWQETDGVINGRIVNDYAHRYNNWISESFGDILKAYLL